MPDEIVIDPEIPEAARTELRSMPLQHLLGFCEAPPGSRRFLGVRASRALRIADTYHGRFVVPQFDLDADGLRTWRRAAAATTKIRESQVLALWLVDAVQVSTVLPFLEWEIAEKLARLSMLRNGQRSALQGVDASAPDVAPVVDAQRRAQSLASNDIEERVQRLEAIADLAANADDGIRREKAVRQLTKLNDSHLDLIAGLVASGNEQAITAQVPADLRAAIELLSEAITRASEAAARSLAISAPDEPSTTS